MSAAGWAAVAAVVFFVVALGAWAWLLSVRAGDRAAVRRMAHARETARRVRAATYKPIRDPDWLRDDDAEG